MLRTRFAVVALCLVLPVTACERPDEQPHVIPPGVSVGPPRAAPEAGSIALPGTEPDTVIEAEAAPGEPQPPAAQPQAIPAPGAAPAPVPGTPAPGTAPDPAAAPGAAGEAAQPPTPPGQ